MEWISVKDRLPEKGKEVLLTDGEQAKEGNLKKDSNDSYRSWSKWFTCDCCYSLGEITHWAELSDLPKDK